MAEYLASIFGTEKDKVNCSFYFKIGACRHGDRCSRIHNKPNFSQTILIQNLYQNPQNMPLGPDGQPIGPPPIGDEEAQEHFDDFFEDVFVELEDKYGEIEEMNVCDNLGDHLIGNVYVKFRREEDAEKAVNELNNRWFNGRPIYAELSPVTDFREACCRQYEMGECTRSGFCNFMHLKPISRDLRRELYGRKRRGKSRSRSRERRRRSRSVERRRRTPSPRRDAKKRRSRSRSRESRNKRLSDRRSRSRERKHRRSEERDKDRSGREKTKEREKRERRDNGNETELDTKLTEKEREAIQSEIDANMNELFSNQESNHFGNGTEDSQDASRPAHDSNSKDGYLNQDSNSMFYNQFEANVKQENENNMDNSPTDNESRFYH